MDRSLLIFRQESTCLRTQFITQARLQVYNVHSLRKMARAFRFALATLDKHFNPFSDFAEDTDLEPVEYWRKRSGVVRGVK